MEDLKNMRNFKRFISGSLATLMIVAAMMTGASAKSYEDVTSRDPYAEQIEILSDIGVIKGTTDTEFSPDAPVTREQMAMLLFRLMIGNDNAGKINTTAFTDLYDDTYNGAISWANASGYILGTSSETFAPREGIMLQDAMTMLVRALGHDSAQMNLGYPWTYIDAAVRLGLDAGLEDLSYTDKLTRAEVAAVLYNALTAEYLIPRTASNGMTFYESTTIIERVFGYDIDESVIVATNNYAIEGASTVTKDGYVTVRTEDGLITVKFEELGIDGTADAALGKNFKLVYKTDEKTRLVTVLGCTELGKSESAETITVGKNNSYIEIGGVKYQVVETLSDALSTNANELLVYAYSASGELTPITTNAGLAALLGAYDATLYFDEKASDVADRLIIKSYAFGKLEIEGGKVNLAGNMKESDLTIINPDKAVDDDYVLYYFNDEHDVLELAAVLPVTESGLVSRLTETTVTIGGTRYKLGNELLGITAADVRAHLTVGEKVRAVLYGDAVVAVASSSTSIFAPSQYLIAKSATTPVFMNGKFGYVMEAIIGGTTETIFVTNSSVTAGDVYRYTTDAAGSYTLIPATVSGGVISSGNSEFVQSNSQNDEIAFMIDTADGTTITKTGSYYALSKGGADAVSSTGLSESAMNFVTSKDTVIIAKNGDTYAVSKGVYTSTITIADGASVTAVFDNEVGGIETLRYLYISDGSLGSIDSTASSVKILAITGSEMIDNKIYYIYSVLNMATGKVESMMSTDPSLIEGANYLTGIDGLITTNAASVANGVITGYTGGTITLDGTTYTLASDALIYKLTADDKVEAIQLSDTYMGNVEIITKGDEVTAVVLLHKARFSAAYEAGTVTVTSRDSLTTADSFALTSLEKLNEDADPTVIDLTGVTPESVSGATFTFRFTKTLEAGTYLLTFTVNGVSFLAQLVIA
ncbi:MAG: S-layer homology domain-containing protein [Ruminococcaceae bacterium]|nr:S-layer homology domain-containing protein [Oscillospiraceae bacterium]